MIKLTTKAGLLEESVSMTLEKVAQQQRKLVLFMLVTQVG